MKQQTRAEYSGKCRFMMMMLGKVVVGLGWLGVA